MTGSEEPVHLAGKALGQHRHICAFFDSTEEEYRVLLPFIKEGLQHGEKAYHIVDPRLIDQHRRQLGSAGIEVPAAEQIGQLELRSLHDVYLRGGRFDRDRMLCSISDVLEHAQHLGYPRVRIIGHAEWAEEDWPGVNEFLEYECRLNQILPLGRDCVVCLYDLSRIHRASIIDAMRTHPLVVLGGNLQVNPFFVPPHELLRELRQRGAAPPSSSAPSE